MQLTNRIESIAIGSFDGIHKGHQTLIEQVEAVVIIERNSGTVTAGYRRSLYIKQFCFFYHFEKIKELTAKEFVSRLQKDFPKLKKIVVGYDFAFGYRKEGNVKLLKELFNGELIVVDEVKERSISIHTQTIKEYLTKGEITIAKELLGRHFKIVGKIIKGQGLGKKELVPTLNLKVYDYHLPKSGVYASKTKIDGVWLKSVTFLGHRVTTDGSFAIESYVLDRDIGIVRGFIEIEFIAFIRENRKFNSLESLKEQIQDDIEVVRRKY
ncbi:MAG: bifunctional riboflavin kinase/FAD synthetase [Sulfurovum sp.]|nr:MAG: bifunctional riboflavin kinase/FAD synthetase [Sulfurovum sp.]